MRRLMVLAALCLLASACAEASAAGPEADTLVPIVVAADDLPAGTILIPGDLAQRSIPASLVTSSMVKPESVAFIVNMRVRLPMLKGDLVQWSFVENSHQEIREACAKFGAEDATALQQVARARQIVLSHGR
ncbi:MAG: SAF domain-containing protein [Myxococcaceae bacterium]|nr:SAF domain-containing protein [Myxococcaceae bacterium]